MSSEELTEQMGKKKIQELEVTRKMLLANLFAGSPIFLQGITYWEEITCVGFNPERSQLQAVVSIKRSTGYSGGLCSQGSPEYVRFFVDWGSGLQDVGLTSFRAHDISDAPPGPQHPLQYLVQLTLADDERRRACNSPVLPQVRAVLSWNAVPSLNPNQPPHFGNTKDVNIQLEPLDITMAVLDQEGLLSKKSTLLGKIDFDKPLPKLAPGPVPWSQLRETYQKAEVPDHRLVYEAVYPMVKSTVASPLAAAQKDLSVAKNLDIDIGQIIDVFTLQSQANTTYEEVVCAGLNSPRDTLGAVIHVKKPYGYSGNLCQPGSREYVAFWADWNNDGAYDAYLGTVAVEVHDIGKIPHDGLYYGVELPANLLAHLKPCHQPNIVRIRVVLSWAVPPSTTDPNDLNYWGNRLDVVVQVRPGAGTTELMDLLYDVGNVAIEDISPASHLAYPSLGVLDPTDCGAPAKDRPFGGSVRIGGRIYNTGLPGTVHYQVQYAPAGTINWLPVTHGHTYQLMHPNPADPFYPRHDLTVHSPDGWFPYLEEPLALPPILERTNQLAVWNTGTLNGLYKLRLAYTKDYPITPASVIHYSNEVTLVVDNTNFTVSPDPNSAVDTAYKLDLVIDGGDCHSYAQGTSIQGHLRALDTHFWKWILDVQPSTHTHGTKTSPECRTYGSLVDQGDHNAAWTLNTGSMDKCGYTVTIWAYDRTIVDSNGAVVHYARKAVGFSVV